MPERANDPRSVWRYPTGFPGMDKQVNPISVALPKLVNATGLDGRFIGALRPFPGMAGESLHGVPTPEGGHTVTTVTNVSFARYVSVQKGTSKHTLKGIVFLADSQSETGVNTSLYFAYRDSSDGGTDVVELEDFDDWDDFKVTGIDSFDVTASGRYIYLSISGDTTSSVDSFSGAEPPYNKAYFWDFKINGWDKFVAGFTNRFMGCMPLRIFGVDLNQDNSSVVVSDSGGATTSGSAVIDLSADTPDLSGVSDGDTVYLSGYSSGDSWSAVRTIDTDGVDDDNDTLTVTANLNFTDTDVVWAVRNEDSQQDSDTAFRSEVYSPGTGIPSGNYSYALQCVSRKHNLRSALRYYCKDNPTSSSSLRWRVTRMNLPVDEGGDTHQIKGNTHEHTCVIDWGIPHVDGFRLYRSTVDDSGNDVGPYELLDQLYLANDYVEKGAYTTGSGIVSVRIGHSPSADGATDAEAPYLSDLALVAQDNYNPYIDDFGPAPRFKLLQAYDGLLVGITNPAEPSSPDSTWGPAEQSPEAIAWSTLTQDEAENFPAANQYRTSDAGEKFLCLELAGDHLFAISNMGIYRVSRSGSQLGINRLQYRVGGISRWGATCVGSILFLVTPSGIKQIDANTGAIMSVTAMDRIILDDGEWADSLTSVHLEYDAKIGALVMLNTSTQEVYILWESTGALTKLEEVPWTFLAAGPDVKTDGPQRAYFVTSDAKIHIIDGAREMGKRSMCGVDADETVNGTCTAGTNSTTIIDSGATFPANCVGFKLHILSGDYQGESGTIEARDSDTQLTISALSGSPAVDDRYSVAPVVTKITLPNLVGQSGEPDPFVRKIAASTTCSFSSLGGETTSGDNPYFRAGMENPAGTLLGSAEGSFDSVPDKTTVRTSFAGGRLYPYLEFKGGNQDWELQAVMVKGQLSSSEGESRQT